MASMQYDVLASKPLTATGQFKDQNNNDIKRCRIKAVYGISGALAGSIVFTDGGSGGPTVMTVNTPTAANQGTFWLLLPGEGILVQTDLYGTLTNATSVMVIYG